MGRRQLLAYIVVLGYIVALVPVLWARRDVARIPRSIWRYTAPHPRELWRGGLVVAYVFGGWPGLLVAFGWRVSSDRRALREEWAHLHRRNVQPRTAHPGTAPLPTPPVATEPEPEIVLADYEALDDAEESQPSSEDAPPASG